MAGGAPSSPQSLLFSRLNNPNCLSLNTLNQDAPTSMQNMHLELQNYPTRMTWFWKEAVLPAGPTFQAPQSRFSLCLLQNNLCAMERPCVCCYSSWFIWLMILLGNRCHEPSTNVPPIPVAGKSSLHGNFKESGSGQKFLETRTDCGHKILWMIIRSRVRKREESFTPSKLISNNPQKYKDVQKKPWTLQLHVM